MQAHYILTVIAILLLIGVFSSKISSKFQLPTLLMFLLVGLIASDHGVKFDNYNVSNFIGAIAMSFILFSGGLDSNLTSMRKCLKTGIILATLGVFLTTILLGAGAYFILNWPLKWCLLLGAVVSSTDAAAVFAILRGKSVSLRGSLAPLLELESGSNDPMAAFMTLFVISIIQEPTPLAYALFLPKLLVQMGVGIIWGYLIGKIGAHLYNRLKLEYEGLYFVMGIAIVLITYGGATCLYGNGFMASYVAGVTMANCRFNYKRGLSRFSDGVAWLMQVMLFMVLGLLITSRQLWAVSLHGIALALILMLVARPLAVFICMIGSKFHFKEKLFISWVGLRGAAPIVLATFPLYYFSSPEEQVLGKELFSLVFFIVILSVLLQGRTLMFMGKLLHLDSPFTKRDRNPLELEVTDALSSVMKEYTVSDNSMIVGKSLAELKFPAGTLVILIRRENSFILARGESVIESADGLLIMGELEIVEKLAESYDLLA